MSDGVKIDGLHEGGYWPLQDFSFARPEKGTPPSLRKVRFATRLVDRMDGPQQLGHDVIDPDATGDVLGGMAWDIKPTDEKKPHHERKIPAWAFAWPVSIEGMKTAARTAVRDKSKLPILMPPASVRPSWDESFANDTRFLSMDSWIPPEWPRLPRGTKGVLLDATHESAQIPLFLHGDPRLVAVNFAGIANTATVVCDEDADGNIDPKRYARLHSFLRVVRTRGGCLKFSQNDKTSPDDAPDGQKIDEELNALAWQLGVSGVDGIAGFGLVYDASGGAASPPAPEEEPPQPYAGPTLSGQAVMPFTGEPAGGTTFLNGAIDTKGRTGVFQRGDGGSKGVLGVASVRGTGPFDVGGHNDQHRIGTTADGEPINSLHISTNAIFKMSDVKDGPIDFHDADDPECAEGDFPYRVHIHFDPDELHPHVCGPRVGKWKLSVKIPILYVRPKPPFTPNPEPTDVDPPYKFETQEHFLPSLDWVPPPIPGVPPVIPIDKNPDPKPNPEPDPNPDTPPTPGVPKPITGRRDGPYKPGPGDSPGTGPDVPPFRGISEGPTPEGRILPDGRRVPITGLRPRAANPIDPNPGLSDPQKWFGATPETFGVLKDSGATMTEWKQSPRTGHTFVLGQRETNANASRLGRLENFPFKYNRLPTGDLGENFNGWRAGTANGTVWYAPPEVPVTHARHIDAHTATYSQASVGMWGSTIFGFGKASDDWGSIVEGFTFQQSGSTLKVQGVDAAGVLDATKTIAFLTPVSLTGGACFNNGSAATPAVRPCSEAGIGIHWDGAGTTFFDVGGAFKFDLNATRLRGNLPINLSGGSTVAPAYAYSSAPSSGWGRNISDEVFLSVLGTQSLTIDSSGTIISAGPIGAPTGHFESSEGADGASGYRISGWAGTGLFSTDAELELHLSLELAGAVMNFSNLGVVTIPNLAARRLGVPDGSAAACGLGFTGDGNTGFRRAGADDMRLVTGGVDRVTFTTALITSTLPIRTPSGTAVAPGLQVGAADKGLFNDGAAGLGLATAGVQRLNLNATRALFAQQVQSVAGSAATPAYVSSTDINTGPYSIGADIYGVSTGGVERMRINATGNVGVGTGASAISGFQVQQATSESTNGVTNIRMGVAATPRLIYEDNSAATNKQFETDYEGATETYRMFFPADVRVAISKTVFKSIGVIQTANGTAALPGYGLKDDTNSGWYQEAASPDTMSLALGGVEKYRFTGTVFRPAADGGASLGQDSTRFDTLYLSSSFHQNRTSGLADSMFIRETFKLTTEATGAQTVGSITIVNNESMNCTVDISGVEDGNATSDSKTAFACYRLFIRGSNAGVANIVATPYSVVNPGAILTAVTFVAGGGATIEIKVNPATVAAMNWTCIVTQTNAE